MRAWGVRAPRCACCSRPMPFGREAHQQEVSILRCKAVLRRTSRGLHRAAGLRVCAHTIAPLRSLSLRRRRSTRACGMRAPCRADWSQSMPYGSPLHQRDCSLPRCTAVLRHATRGFQRAAGLPVCAHEIVPLRLLSLGRRRSTRAFGGRAPRCAGCSRPMLFGSKTHHREVSILRCKAVLRRTSRGLHRAAGLRVCAHAITPLHSLSLGRRRSTRACSVRSPCRADWS